MELEQLQQLVGFSEEGTLTALAEKLYVSQPMLTRTMKKLEEELGVSLFVRSKNKLTLNDTGKLAVEYAKKVLEERDNFIRTVRDYDKKKRTVFIGSCAPVPLTGVTSAIVELFPEYAVSAQLQTSDEMTGELRKDKMSLCVLPFEVKDESVVCYPIMTEALCFSLPPGHPFSQRKGLHFSDMNGESLIMYSKVGFWYDLCREKMPKAKFLMLEERLTYDELVGAPALPSFYTRQAEMIHDSMLYKNRVNVPILDKEATVTYYLTYRAENEKFFGCLREYFKVK